MTLAVHLTSLTKKKEQLEQEITHEMTRPYPNDLRVKELKLKNLYIKQKIQSIKDRPIKPLYDSPPI